MTDRGDFAEKKYGAEPKRGEKAREKPAPKLTEERARRYVSLPEDDDLEVT